MLPMPQRVLILSAVLLAGLSVRHLSAQSARPAPPPDYSKEPFVIERIVNAVQYENDGRHTLTTDVRVRVQSASGVQEFGIIQLPYPSAMGQADIVNVKVTKPSGTVVNTPSDGIVDLPAQITIAAPMYSDMKVKQLAVRGLDVGDVLEFRQTFDGRTPLMAGEFWHLQNFMTNAVVLDEQLEIRVPRDREVKIKAPKLQPTTSDAGAYRVYSWKTAHREPTVGNTASPKTDASSGSDPPAPDVQVTSLRSWDQLADWYRQLQASRLALTPELRAKAQELTQNMASEDEKIRALYSFVATRFRYIGVSFGIGRYQPHAASEVLSNGYGDCKDKHTLFAALLDAVGIKAYPALISSARLFDADIPSPAQFDHMITAIPRGDGFLWLDTTPEVAPLGLLMAPLRNGQAFVIPASGPGRTARTPADPPFPQALTFKIAGALSAQGTLTGQANVLVRGDLELLFRLVFHQAAPTRWTDIVQAISQGWAFSGTVSDVSADTPEATDKAFAFSYKYERKDYPLWPDAFYAPLPPINLADLPDAADTNTGPIKLERSGSYQLQATIGLPPNMTPSTRQGVNVATDFAEYHATYRLAEDNPNTMRIDRDLVIKAREIPRARRAEYETFWKAVAADLNSPLIVTSSGSGAAAVPDRASAAVRVQTLIALGDSLFPQDLDGAISQYRRALELQPDNATAHYDIGKALYRKKDYDGAIAEYREAIRFRKDDPEAHYDLGEALFMKQNFTDATVEYRETLRLKPDHARAHGALGGVLIRERTRDSLNKAVDELKQAVAIDKDYARGYENLGTAFGLLGRLDEALDAWRQVKRLSPDNPNAPTIVAVLLVQKKQYAEALTEIQPLIENTKDARVLVTAGQAYVNTGELEKGAAAFQSAVEIDSSIYILNIASYELANHDAAPGAAVRYAGLAVTKQEQLLASVSLPALRPGDLQNVQLVAALWDTMGWAQLKAGNLQSAHMYLEASWKLMQRSAPAYHLGQYFERAGNKAEAIHYYALSRAAAPDIPEADGRLRALAGAQAEGVLGNVRDQLSSMRILTMPRATPGVARAEFFVLFTKGTDGPVADVRFISGSSALAGAAAAIKSVRFDVVFPDDGPTRLVRRGILDCAARDPNCQFVLLPTETISAVN
jgi:tetratricopeptide (TPR) repeat protein